MLYRYALGDAIREARMSRGMTLRDVSLRASVALGYISEVERGAKEVSSEILSNLAEGMNIPVSALVSSAAFSMEAYELLAAERTELAR